jgi:electron transport complex protein RnfG
MNQLVKYGLILAGICFASTLVLSFVYRMTGPKIEEGIRREEEAARRFLLPAAAAFERQTRPGLEYYEGRRDGKTVGYCLSVVGHGYSGFVRLMVGIDPEGKIAGLRVLEHQETPGLGARIAETRPGESEPWFLAKFRGLPGRSLELKDIQAITGATITSRAVVRAVREGVEGFYGERSPVPTDGGNAKE